MADVMTRICSTCGDSQARANQHLCHACHAAAARAYRERRKLDPEWVERERARGRAKGARVPSSVKALANLRHRLRQHGMSLADFERMKAEQGDVCAICRERCDKGGELSIDHCHRTGQVRGLLCRNCNVALGYLRDDPERLRAAARYLEETST